MNIRSTDDFLDKKDGVWTSNITNKSTKNKYSRAEKNVTYLEDSLFFRFQNEGIVFCRKSISAVLLFHISKYYAQTTCLLHPQPAYNFSVDLLPSVPFVEVLVPKIEDYSVGDSYQIKTRWVPDNLPDGEFIYNQWR